MYSDMPFNDGDTLWERYLQEILALCEYHRAHYDIIKGDKVLWSQQYAQPHCGQNTVMECMALYEYVCA